MPKFLQPVAPKPRKILSAAQLRARTARVLRARSNAKIAAMRAMAPAPVVVNVHVHHPDAIVKTSQLTPHVS